MGVISSFVEGFWIPFRAVLLILSNRKLFLWSIVPLVISIILEAVLWGSVLAPARDWVTIHFRNWLLGVFGSPQNHPDVQDVAQWIVTKLVELFLLTALVILFASLVNIVALPFNDFVARATEEALSPPLSYPRVEGFAREAHLMLIDGGKNVFALFGLVACIAVGWVPVLNFIALVMAWFFITFQYISYPQTRRGVGTFGAIQSLLFNPGLTIGFAIPISLGLTVPILGIFVPTIAVVGGTMVFAAMERRAKGVLKA